MVRLRTGLFAALVALICALPAAAYEILLDIDTDDDPTTINGYTELTSVTVRIVLAPTEPDELITTIGFGLGGSCWECDGVQDYGVNHDLYAEDLGDWDDHDWLESWWDSALYLGCAGDPGFHDVFYARAPDDGLTLVAPIFIATFTAWVSEPMWGWCPQVTSNLATFPSSEFDYWDYIQLGGPAVSVEQQSWSALKVLYR